MDTQFRTNEADLKVHSNRSAFRHLMGNALHYGHESSPRGLPIKEVFDAQVHLHPEYPFQGFKARSYNLDYFKHEMLWKLGAGRMDDSIKAHAKMWESVQNPDGSFNSNYGQYWFGQQMGFWKVVQELVRDKDSRRAVIPMLSDEHLTPDTIDTVCTESISFRIRGHALHMSVHMRSSDQIFGLGTDVPTFSVLMMLVLGMLRDYHPGLMLGKLTITAVSSHIYERHYNMVEKILNEDASEYDSIRLPEPSGPGEVLAIIGHRGKRQDVPSHWHLYRFIYGSA